MYLARKTFDRFTSYNLEDMNEQKWLRRFLFLETIAGKLKGDHFLASYNAICMRTVTCLSCQLLISVSNCVSGGHWVSVWFSLNPVSVNN